MPNAMKVELLRGNTLDYRSHANPITNTSLNQVAQPEREKPTIHVYELSIAV